MNPEPTQAQKRRARNIYKALEERYPDAHCALYYNSPFQLLVATALSAQCTDVLVNQVTPPLFKAFPTSTHMADAALEDIESLINRVNFWRNKSKYLLGMSRALVETHNGEVPADMDALVKLPGVARKTANVVLGNAFNKPVGVTVDTHAKRLANRMGLSSESDVLKIEKDLMALYPRKHWTKLTHLLIEHGRTVCKARHNKCQLDGICQKYCKEAK